MAEAALPLGSLWVGERLGWLDRLALHSCVARGHEVTLFHLGGLKDPAVSGLRLAHARETWAYPADLPGRVPAAVFADLFRLWMLRDARLAWVDTDVLCWRPLRAFDGYLLGREAGGMVNNAVLWMPEGSAALGLLLERFDDPGLVPDWLDSAAQREIAAASEGERLATAARLVPNAFGPKALSWALNRTGEMGHARPQQVLNPVPWGLADIYFNPHGGVEGWLSDDTLAIHLYASRIRKLHKRVAPYEGSFIAWFAQEIGFDLSGLRPRQ